jgi:hypothetical protein
LPVIPSNWQIFGSSDFNLDGTDDLLFRDVSSDLTAVWVIKNSQLQPVAANSTDFIKTSVGAIAKAGANWTIETLGQLN